MVVFCYSAANVHRGKQGKYVGLNRSHEQFNHVNKGNHDCRQHSNRIGFEDEDQSNEGQNYNVTCGDGYK